MFIFVITLLTRIMYINYIHIKFVLVYYYI